MSPRWRNMHFSWFVMHFFYGAVYLVGMCRRYIVYGKRAQLMTFPCHQLPILPFSRVDGEISGGIPARFRQYRYGNGRSRDRGYEILVASYVSTLYRGRRFPWRYPRGYRFRGYNVFASLNHYVSLLTTFDGLVAIAPQSHIVIGARYHSLF